MPTAKRRRRSITHRENIFGRSCIEEDLRIRKRVEENELILILSSGGKEEFISLLRLLLINFCNNSTSWDEVQTMLFFASKESFFLRLSLKIIIIGEVSFEIKFFAMVICLLQWKRRHGRLRVRWGDKTSNDIRQSILGFLYNIAYSSMYACNSMSGNTTSLVAETLLKKVNHRRQQQNNMLFSHVVQDYWVTKVSFVEYRKTWKDTRRSIAVKCMKMKTGSWWLLKWHVTRQGNGISVSFRNKTRDTQEDLRRKLILFIQFCEVMLPELLSSLQFPFHANLFAKNTHQNLWNRQSHLSLMYVAFQAIIASKV